MNQWKASLALSLSIWIVEHLLPNISTHAFIQSVCHLLHYIISEHDKLVLKNTKILKKQLQKNFKKHEKSF